MNSLTNWWWAVLTWSRSAASWEPIVPRSARRSVDTRA
jgi:hypothetical protein